MQSSKRVLFRVDASSYRGTGHVFRCLTLANALRELGCEIRFLCRSLPGNLIGKLQDEDAYEVVVVPEEFDVPDSLVFNDIFRTLPKTDWLIVDHYDLDKAWESAARAYVDQILVIDDLANRAHDCDILLDQNHYPTGNHLYEYLLPSNCKQLLGIDYALLRPEFITERTHLQVRSGEVRRIMISLGGADPVNATEPMMEAVARLNRPDLDVDVIVGASNPRAKEIFEKAVRFGFKPHQDVRNIAAMMSASDLFLGAGGTTTWERMVLGLPGIVVSISETHADICAELAEQGYQVYLGASQQLSVADIHSVLEKYLANPAELKRLSQNGMALVDGNGLQRVIEVLGLFSFVKPD